MKRFMWIKPRCDCSAVRSDPREMLFNVLEEKKIQKYNGKVVVISGLKINFVLNWDRLRRPVSSHRHAYLFNP